MAESLAKVVLDAVAKEVSPPPRRTLKQTRVVRVRRNLNRLQSSMGCEGGCPMIHAHQEGQNRVEDAEDGVRESARGD